MVSEPVKLLYFLIKRSLVSEFVKFFDIFFNRFDIKKITHRMSMTKKV